MAADWCNEGFLIADGKSLEYHCFGPAPNQAPTMVLLHEGLGSCALWRDFPEALSKATGFGVFAYSRAGYGQSASAELPRPLDYMTHEAVNVLPQVLEAIGFQRGVLLGHSDGATIAAIYAGSVSDLRIRATILMAPHFFTEEMGLIEIAKTKETFKTGNLKARMAKYHRDPENTFWGWNDAWLDPGFADWNVADVIDYFRIPTLIIQGSEDAYGTIAQINEIETRSYAPVETLLLDNCGHAPFSERPEAVLSAVRDFCIRLERIEAAVPALT